MGSTLTGSLQTLCFVDRDLLVLLVCNNDNIDIATNTNDDDLFQRGVEYGKYGKDNYMFQTHKAVG